MTEEVARQGKVQGLILPPPDIRAVVDKTAAFVAKHGKGFEEKILGSAEGKTAKFNFMRPADPYHAYYEFKIRELEEGGSATAKVPSIQQETPTPVVEPPTRPSASQQEAPISSSTSVKASLLNPIARIIMNKKGTEPPVPFEFSSGHPTGLSSLDMDVIKLTAQYTAVSGRDFLASLAQREQRNPQFDFLKPTHMLFSYFTGLVDAYGKVLHPDATLRKLVEDRADRTKALEMAVLRWEWNRAEEERRGRENVEADKERAAFLAIDWCVSSPLHPS